MRVRGGHEPCERFSAMTPRLLFLFHIGGRGDTLRKFSADTAGLVNEQFCEGAHGIQQRKCFGQSL